MCNVPFGFQIVLVLLAMLPVGMLGLASLMLSMMPAGESLPLVGPVNRPLFWSAVAIASALIDLGQILILIFEIGSCVPFRPH